MLSLCLNQVELTVLTLYISTTKLLLLVSSVYFGKMLNKPYLNFFFSPFGYNIENIEPKCNVLRTNVLNSRTMGLNISFCVLLSVF